MGNETSANELNLHEEFAREFANFEDFKKSSQEYVAAFLEEFPHYENVAISISKDIENIDHFIWIVCNTKSFSKFLKFYFLQYLLNEIKIPEISEQMFENCDSFILKCFRGKCLEKTHQVYQFLLDTSVTLEKRGVKPEVGDVLFAILICEWLKEFLANESFYSDFYYILCL